MSAMGAQLYGNQFNLFQGQPQMQNIDIENLDEILDCRDDLMEIEQTAFMDSSKIMLQMIDNMVNSIDLRIANVNKNEGQGMRLKEVKVSQ